MDLTLYFRLIMMSIFQSGVTSGKKSWMDDTMSYNNTHFRCPRVVAKDGFAVSLQVNYCNYCSSNNGYRTLGDTMEEVEFGFPSMNEPLMFEYSEMWGNQYNQKQEENPLLLSDGNGVSGFSQEETERFIELYSNNKSKFNRVVSKYKGKKEEIISYIKEVLSIREFNSKTKVSDLEFDVTGTVGRIPVTVLETIFEKHGGIDWEATINVDTFNGFTNNK